MNQLKTRSKRPRHGDRAHVAFDVLGLDAARRRVRARPLEEKRRQVEPRHTDAPAGQPVRQPSMAAREVEHLHPGLQLEQLPDEVRLPVRPLLGERRLPEVEVVLAEQVVELGHGGSVRARG